MQAIHACHAAVHAKGAPRIATDIRIGSCTRYRTAETVHSCTSAA